MTASSLTTPAPADEVEPAGSTGPRVVNLSAGELGDAVYVGRRSQRRGLEESAFANPYRVGADGTRADVIQRYRRWLLGQPALLDRLHELRGRRLACWCKPAACHADVLVELVDADALLDELKAAGVRVEARGDRLALLPASAVDDALVARVRPHKAALLALLAARSTPPLQTDTTTPTECEPLKHEPVPAGRDDRGWTRYVCHKCGRFYCYSPDAPPALRPALEATYPNCRGDK